MRLRLNQKSIYHFSGYSMGQLKYLYILHIIAVHEISEVIPLVAITYVIAHVDAIGRD